MASKHYSIESFNSRLKKKKKKIGYRYANQDMFQYLKKKSIIRIIFYKRISDKFTELKE